MNTSPRHLVIPDGVTEIPTDAYYQNNDIETVVIPASVTFIDTDAFAFCENLRKVTILGPAELGQSVFIGCKKLTEVYLADGVTSIGCECFALCDRLKELFIPASVTAIGWEIAGRENADYSSFRFLCYRRESAPDWHPNWNLKYRDSRFGDDRNHFFFHHTLYGINRDGKYRPEN